MNPSAMIPIVDGLLGNIIRLAGDTGGNNVVQGGARWAENIKLELRRQDAIGAQVSVLYEAIPRTAATATNATSNFSSTSKILGMIVRNNDTAARFAFIYNVAAATLSAALTDMPQVAHHAVAARTAANAPVYAFANYPATLDSSLASGGTGLSWYPATTSAGGTVGTDGTLTVIYTAT